MERIDSYRLKDREPTAEDIEICFQFVQGKGYDLVIGLGGGSCLDVAKLVSAALTYPKGMKGILQGDGIDRPGVKVLMIPTTAGTGAEVTPNAILLYEAEGLKKGIVSSYLVPTKAVIDPGLMVSMPKGLTASTGVDALAHSLESYISKKANVLSDLFAKESIRLIFKSLKKAFANGQDMEARTDMAFASLYGGIALSNSGTCGVHALAYPLGGQYRIPHGISNAILLYPVMEVNQPFVEDRLTELAMGIGFSPSTTGLPARFLQELKRLIREIDIPDNLKPWGISARDLDSLALSASKVTRLLANNPKVLTVEEIRSIYEKVI